MKGKSTKKSEDRILKLKKEIEQLQYLNTKNNFDFHMNKIKLKRISNSKKGKIKTDKKYKFTFSFTIKF